MSVGSCTMLLPEAPQEVYKPTADSTNARPRMSRRQSIRQSISKRWSSWNGKDAKPSDMAVQVDELKHEPLPDAEDIRPPPPVKDIGADDNLQMPKVSRSRSLRRGLSKRLSSNSTHTRNTTQDGIPMETISVSKPDGTDGPPATKLQDFLDAHKPDSAGQAERPSTAKKHLRWSTGALPTVAHPLPTVIVTGEEGKVQDAMPTGPLGEQADQSTALRRGGTLRSMLNRSKSMSARPTGGVQRHRSTKSVSAIDARFRDYVSPNDVNQEQNNDHDMNTEYSSYALHEFGAALGLVTEANEYHYDHRDYY